MQEEYRQIDFTRVIFTVGEYTAIEQIKPIQLSTNLYVMVIPFIAARKWYRERSIVDDARIQEFLVSVSRSNVILTRDKTTATIFQRTKK